MLHFHDVKVWKDYRLLDGKVGRKFLLILLLMSFISRSEERYHQVRNRSNGGVINIKIIIILSFLLRFRGIEGECWDELIGILTALNFVGEILQISNNTKKWKYISLPMDFANE